MVHELVLGIKFSKKKKKVVFPVHFDNWLSSVQMQLLSTSPQNIKDRRKINTQSHKEKYNYQAVI